MSHSTKVRSDGSALARGFDARRGRRCGTSVARSVVSTGNAAWVVSCSCRIGCPSRTSGPEGQGPLWCLLPGASLRRCARCTRRARDAGSAGSVTCRRLPEAHAARRRDATRTSADSVPVPLSASEVALYYDGFSNGVLWPLFHYLLDKVRLDASNEWRAYRAVNERFADVDRRRAAPGRHGLGARLPADARAGDAAQARARRAHRVLPARPVPCVGGVPHPAVARGDARGLLGADLIGFHTASYRHNFIHSAAQGARHRPRRRQRWSGKTARVRARRLPDQHRHRRVRRASPEPSTQRVEQLREETAAAEDRARRRSARLHQGHPAPPARVRAPARARAAAARARST